MVQIHQREWDEVKTYELSFHCSYIVGHIGKYYLFSIPHTVIEEYFTHFSISMNDFETNIFAATESDLKRFEHMPTEKGMLSVIHPVVTLNLGQNYAFNGCMAYVAECIGYDKTIYDYWHFAMATQDTFTQIHCDDINHCTDGVSDKLFSKQLVGEAFESIGHRCLYFDDDKVRNQKDVVMSLIKEYIDKGIPVISKGFEGEKGYDSCIICGYTDEGALKIMFRDNSEPILQNNILDVTKAIVFLGEKIKEVDLKQFYTDTIRRIPSCLNRKAESSVTFGKEAFRAWADSLIDGSISNLEKVNSWIHYGYNLCIAGTNAYVVAPMAKDILRKCPEFKDTPVFQILEKVAAQFDRQNKIFHELMEMGYGFEISSDKLKDTNYMRPAADKILEFYDVCDKINEIYEGILDNEEIWSSYKYKLIHCEKQEFPKNRFVGIKYGDNDRMNGAFGYLWGQWFETEKFAALEKLLTEDFKTKYNDTDAYIGLMRHKVDEPFEYWIGMFLPHDCVVPEGFSYVDFDFDSAGICFIKGREENVYGHENECYDKLLENGMEVVEDKEGACWFFERYACPRFTTPDDLGNVILDIGYFVKREEKK